MPNVGALAFDDDLLELLSSVDRLCGKSCRAAVVAGQDADGAQQLWEGLADIGVLGLGTPEVGGSIFDAVAVAHLLGAAWAPGPIVASLAIVPFLPEELRTAVIDGTRTVAVGTGGAFLHADAGAVVVEVTAGRARLVDVTSRAPAVSHLGAGWSRVESIPGRELDGAGIVSALDVVLAAYLAGACDRMVRTAGAYATERFQFGRPIAANQAVSHPLAELLTAAFAAEGLARVGARRLARTGAPGADTAAARLAAVTLVRRTCRAVPQAFGAVGLSVEGPVSAMLRRAPMLSLLPPGIDDARERVAAAVYRGPAAEAIPFDLGLPDDIEAFRREVAAFADERRHVRGYVRDEATRAAVKQVCRELGARGWLSLSWPTAQGGGGRSLLHEFVLWDELAYAEVTRPPTGLGVVAKAIIEHGDDEQRAAFLPRLRSGEIDIALGYSEPEAGSDLASLRTRARRDGDGYLVSGEKRWTSNGHVADYLWLLCRTGAPEARANGLTILLVDMPSPGMTVRPIHMLDGARLNEIHFDDVFVPLDRRVGEENGAWSIISSSLAVERYAQMPPKKVQADFERVAAWLADHGRAGEPAVRACVAELAVEVASVAMAANAAVLSQEAGLPTALVAMHAKLLHSTTTQHIADAVLEVGGPEVPVAEQLQSLWLQSLGETLGGGSTEILRSSVAKLEMGLPAR